MRLEVGLEPFSDRETLTRKLAEVADEVAAECIGVGVHCEERTAMAAQGKSTSVDEIDAFTFPAACLIKLFTATLVMLAIGDGLLTLDTELSDALSGLPRSYAILLSGVRIRHLLNHAHGLDGSGNAPMARTGDRRIDLFALCEQLARNGRMAESGDLYCYSSVGSRLAGCVIENLFGAPYEAVLSQRLLEPLGIRCRASLRDELPLCPAVGMGLRLSVADLVKFLTWHLHQYRLWQEDAPVHCPIGMMYDDIYPIPGFNLEKGSGLGWRWYGAGWFGHSMAVRPASALVRIHPAAKVGIAVASLGHPVHAVATRLFDAALPDLVGMKIPTPLTDSELTRLELGHYVGRYENAVTRVSVTRNGVSGLRIEVYERATHGRPAELKWSGGLTPCSDGVFLTDLSASGYGAWSSFSRLGSSGYDFLVNGPSVLRRRQ